MTNFLIEDILTYFESKNNRFKNSAGMELGLSDGNVIWTYFSLVNHDGLNAVYISTEGDSMNEFISGFDLKKVKDIDRLDYNSSWIRYLNSGAEIGVTPWDLEATINFRICNRKTMIFSRELHYYDKVYEHLTIPEDFEGYIVSNENRLHLAGQNRYKMNQR